MVDTLHTFAPASTVILTEGKNLLFLLSDEKQISPFGQNDCGFVVMLNTSTGEDFREF